MKDIFVRKVWAVWTCILLSAAAAAASNKGTVTVSVTDPDGQPVLDAHVVLIETQQHEFVDDEGRAMFKGVPAGAYHLQADSRILGSAVEEFTLTAGQSYEAVLKMTRGVHYERIIVTATVGGRGSAEVVMPVIVLDKTELAERMQPTLGETLAQEPGIQSNFFGVGASRPIFRGQGGGRVRILEGGLGVGDASTASPDHAVSTDPMSADTVEVLRGPAALMYDTSAIGGLVNILDRRIPDHAPRKPFGGSLDLRLGSVAEEQTGAVNLDGGSDRIAWHFDGARRDTEDYDIPEPAIAGDPDSPSGTLPNSSLESTTLTAGASILFDNGFVGASVRRFDTEYGIQEIELEPEDAPPAPEEEGGVLIDLEQRRFDLRGRFGFEGGFVDNLSFGVGVTDYEHTEFEGGAAGTRFFNESQEGRLELAHNQGSSRAGVIGVQYTNRDAEAQGAEAFLPRTETETLALFALQEVSAGPLRLEFGGRYDTTDVRVGTLTPEFQARVAAAGCSVPGNHDFDAFSASAGAVWLSDNGYGIGASLTHAVRSPAAEELYSCGPHLATQSFEVGNTRLDEETGLSFDLSLRKRTGRVTGDLTFFVTRFADYIYEEYTNVFRTEEGEAFDTFATTPAEVVLPEFRFTQADAEFHGAELSLDVDLLSNESHHVGLELTGDTVRGELRDPNQYLPRIPADRIGIGVHYRGDHWYGSASIRFTVEQTRLAPSEIITDPTPNGVEGLDLLGGPTDDYTLVQATVGYRMVRGGRLHDFSLRGSNLTDAEARVHTSRLKNVAPMPGADVSFVYGLVF